MHEQYVHHRGFIHDEKIALQRLIIIAQEPSCGRIDFQQTMNGLRFEARGLCEPFRGPSGGSAQQALHSLGSQDHQDRVHQGGLANTGLAGDDGDTIGQDCLQRFPPARGECPFGPLLTPRDRLIEIDARIDRYGWSQSP